jgi:hypothetical protein
VNCVNQEMSPTVLIFFFSGFHRAGTKVIGWWLFTSSTCPFLGIGYTTHFFQARGQVPFLN